MHCQKVVRKNLSLFELLENMEEIQEFNFQEEQKPTLQSIKNKVNCFMIVDLNNIIILFFFAEANIIWMYNIPICWCWVRNGVWTLSYQLFR